MKTRLCVSSSACSNDFKLYQMCWGDKGITSITLLWLSRDLCTISRPDTEWGLDFVYQITHALLTSNVVEYVGMTKKIHH